jgi:hypothetical protein
MSIDQCNAMRLVAEEKIYQILRGLEEATNMSVGMIKTETITGVAIPERVVSVSISLVLS